MVLAAQCSEDPRVMLEETGVLADKESDLLAMLEEGIFGHFLSKTPSVSVIGVANVTSVK